MVGVVISPQAYDRIVQDDFYTKEDEKSYQKFKEEYDNGETYTLEEVKKMFDV